MTLIFGFYGSVNTHLGPNCSRLIPTNPFFVQSIKVIRFFFGDETKIICSSYYSHLVFFLILLPQLLCTDLILFANRLRKWMSQNLGQCYMGFINLLPWILRSPGLKHIMHLYRPLSARHISHYLYFIFLNPFFCIVKLKFQLFATFLFCTSK
jgi:hypothetical protein